ncbi:MAG: hypothetical protein V4494_05530 [Chlamydiota bacterium]
MKFRYFFLFLIFSANCVLHAIEHVQLDPSKKLSVEERVSMLEMQKFQREYDEEFWFNRDFEKFRHVFLHLVDSVGKIAKYCETKEHGKEPDPTQLIDEVLPDLLMHTLQFANAFDIDLGEKYEERINANIKRGSVPFK